MSNIPENEILSPQEAWADFISLKQALNSGSQETVLLPITLDAATLAKKLVELGICENETEVIARAVRTFFVAVSPAPMPEQQYILRESGADYHTEP